MLIAINRYGREVFGPHALEDMEPFYCPECHELVSFRRYHTKIWHFAHYPGSYCRYGDNESPAHRLAKVELYSALANSEGVSECTVEHQVGNLRADVYAVIHGHKVAIEVQLSDTSLLEVKRKLETYTANGVHTLYLVRDINEGTYIPSEWLRYLHAMYRQNLYSWYDGKRVAVRHLGRYQWRAGQICTPDFYLQKRPVYRLSRELDLAAFSPEYRREEELADRHIGITDALLWHHTLKPWWDDELDRQRVYIRIRRN